MLGGLPRSRHQRKHPGGSDQPSSSPRDRGDPRQPEGRDPPAPPGYLPARRRRSAADRQLWRPSPRSAWALPGPSTAAPEAEQRKPRTLGPFHPRYRHSPPFYRRGAFKHQPPPLPPGNAETPPLPPPAPPRHRLSSGPASPLLGPGTASPRPRHHPAPPRYRPRPQPRTCSRTVPGPEGQRPCLGAQCQTGAGTSSRKPHK